MARILILKVDKSEFDNDFMANTSDLTVYKPGRGIRKAHLTPRPDFIHYAPNVGPIFRSFRVDSGFLDSEEHLQMRGNKMASPLIITRLTDCGASLGESVVLRCEIHGNPKPKITWLKDHKTMTTSNKIWMHYNGRVAELTLTTVTKMDGGWYTCRAESFLGSRETSCTLHIGEESAPRVPRAKSVYEYRSQRSFFPALNFFCQSHPGRLSDSYKMPHQKLWTVAKSRVLSVK